MSKEFYLMVHGEVPATYCQRHDLQHVFPSKQMLPLPIHEQNKPFLHKIAFSQVFGQNNEEEPSRESDFLGEASVCILS